MNVFTANRERLMAALEGGVIVLSAYTEMQRGNDMAAAFEQESNFWWLTGIEEANWLVVIDGTRQKTWLVSPHRNETQMIFDGSLSVKDAVRTSGIDAVIPHDEAEGKLRELAKKHSVVYTLGDHPHADYFDFTLNPALRKNHEMLQRIFNSVRDCRKDLAKLRAIKQPHEITAMKKAISATVDAFSMIKERLSTFAYEYEVEAEFTYHFRRHGLTGHAYDPIIAAGKNACTLHYVHNNDKLKKQDLLLMDVGARVAGYAADITRTFALSMPTKRQEAVHKAVQEAQSHIISLLKPGLLIEEYQRNTETCMKAALLSLGLMKNEADDKSYHRYFPHAISHGLGVDVHDALGAPRMFMSGMVLTVEPGIYIPEEAIGIRIEDDILITDKGHTNLSARLSTDL